MDPLHCDLVATWILSGGLVLAYVFASVGWILGNEESVSHRLPHRPPTPERPSLLQAADTAAMRSR